MLVFRVSAFLLVFSSYRMALFSLYLLFFSFLHGLCWAIVGVCVPLTIRSFFSFFLFISFFFFHGSCFINRAGTWL